MAMRKACVMGWPIGHSRSPSIHRYWLKLYGLDGDYLPQAVAPESFAVFVRGLAEAGFCGGNVTLPHKEAAFKLCDRATALATKLGAANTLWLEGGKLCADNTDVAGFLANLDEQAPGWQDHCDKAVVVGGGGAPRAILAGLAERKIPSALIVNRSIERAQKLAEEAAGWGLPATAVAFRPDGDFLHGAGLLVNTTSLGMTGQPDLDLDLSALPPEALVSDIVYAPLKTQLLQAAEARGLKISTGVGMLLHQAAPGFAHWFGRFD